MDAVELLSLIQQGEDSTTQFKRQFDSPDALAAEICAFANTRGGRILVGVSDKGDIVGVADVQKLNGWISNVASQRIDPPIEVMTQNLIYDRRVVVVIEVPLGPNKPYAVGRTEFWVKVGADKRRATREELRRLMQASGSLYADESPVLGAGIEDIDIERFRRFHEDEYGWDLVPSGEDLRRALANLKLLKGDCPTLAGLLLFGRRPERLRRSKDDRGV